MILTSSFLQHFPTLIAKSPRPSISIPILAIADDKHVLELIHLQRFSYELNVYGGRDPSGQRWFLKIKCKTSGPSSLQASLLIAWPKLVNVLPTTPSSVSLMWCNGPNEPSLAIVACIEGWNSRGKSY